MRRRGISASSEAEAEPPSLKGPQKADDVDPFFPLAVAAKRAGGLPWPGEGLSNRSRANAPTPTAGAAASARRTSR
jgi:hypothetical protein